MNNYNVKVYEVFDFELQQNLNVRAGSEFGIIFQAIRRTNRAASLTAQGTLEVNSQQLTSSPLNGHRYEFTVPALTTGEYPFIVKEGTNVIATGKINVT